MSHAKHLVVVWDLPIRLFHWCLVILVGVLFLTASMGALDVHELAGEGAFALLLFRLIWGVVGSQTARFNDFIGGLAAIRQYLVYRQSKSLGHNPLGGWMVVAMLASLLIQASTGLIANDGISFQGPLAHGVTPSLSDMASSVHHGLTTLLEGLVVIHVTSILLYWVIGLLGYWVIGLLGYWEREPGYPNGHGKKMVSSASGTRAYWWSVSGGGDTVRCCAGHCSFNSLVLMMDCWL